MIQKIFNKSNVENTELFAIDIELVVQLLSSFEGKVIYPATLSKEDIFDTATDEINKNTLGKNRFLVPNGKYYLSEKVKDIGIIKASMCVENGEFIVQKGCLCLPCNKDWMPEPRRNAKIKDGILMEDVRCKSPSAAAWVVLGSANNGWITWKTDDGKPTDTFRVRKNKK